ncbi:hypothetical protein [Gimesia maris]|uniref:hypothetical protein n=1 Tax=Gimesia maris TaxID=122 RepID=UPI0032EC77CD
MFVEINTFVIAGTANRQLINLYQVAEMKTPLHDFEANVVTPPQTWISGGFTPGSAHFSAPLPFGPENQVLHSSAKDQKIPCVKIRTDDSSNELERSPSMIHSKVTFYMVLILTGLIVFSSSENNQAANPQVDPSQVILRAIETPDGSQLEIRIGHLVCKTDQLTVQRKEGPEFTVQPVGNKVHVISDRQRIAAQHVEYPLAWLTGAR